MTDGRRIVGLVGLGAMGGGMARNLKHNAVELWVYDADAAVRATFGSSGFTVAPSLEEIGHNCDIVILMLPHPDVTMEVVAGAGGLAETMAPGSIVIDTSTDGPGAVKECGQVLMVRGVRMVDAPVGRGNEQAATGDLMLLVGGDSDTIHEVHWLLEILGNEIYICGPLGSGQVLKLINNLVSVGNVALIAEAYAMARTAGMDSALVAKVLAGTAADSWQLRNALERRLPALDFSPGFKLDLAKKDLALAVQMSDEIGYVPAPAIANAALSFYERASDLGLGDLDQCALLAVADESLARKLVESRD